MQTIYQQRAFRHDPAIVRLARRTPNRDGGNVSSASTIVEDRLKGVEVAPRTLEEGPQGKGIEGEKAAKEVNPYLVTFEGTCDSHDPHHWPTWKKWGVHILVSQMAILVGAAAAINSGAAEYAAADFGVSSEIISLDTALFLIGFGVASPLLAPLSELGGRNPVYLVTFFMFSLFEIGCGFSTNLHTRLILRFFAGMTGATPLSNAGGTIGDMFDPLERAFAFPIYSAAGFLGPTAAPMIGGYIGLKYHYQWCDFVTAIWAGAIVIMAAFFLPETFAPEILKMKAKALRQATGDERYMTALEMERQTVPFKVHFVEALQRPFQMLFKEPIILFFSLYLSVVYVVLFGDLVAFPVVFAPRGLNSGEVGLCFLPISVGLIIVACFTPLIVKFYKKEMKKAEAEGLPRVQPEERLRLAMIGTWCVPISLFWFAWTCRTSISIWSSLGSQVLFGMGILTIFISSYAYIIDAYLSTAASALSVLTLVRYPISGAAVMFTLPMFDTLGNEWALTLLGFLSILCSFIPYVFYFYGPKIRSWSTYTPRLPGE